MKKITPILTVGLMSMAMTAGAETTFEKSATDFWTTHRSSAFMGDFTGNDHLDIFYGGQGNNRFNDPVGWWWQIQNNFCINNGDGTFTIDGYDVEEREYIDEGSGESKIAYDRVWNNHGLRGTSFNQYAAIDYNNDGLLDILLFGRTEWDIFLNDDEKNDDYLILYKNLGDGKFEIETNAVFPRMRPDNNSKNFSLAVGDYDRDGYVDFLVTATEIEREDNMPGRTVSLYRNINGTGEFKDMKIAETKGGVYTNEVKGDDDSIIVEKQLLDGYFLPLSGNVHFADLNNDGWLDIIADGWADNNWDGIHNAGNTAKIYINVNGEKFIDATPDVPSFYTLRSSGSSIADFDKDGYLDYFMTGWGDNGYNWNAFLFYNIADNETYFDEPLTCDNLGLDGTEGCRQLVRDFDGDGFIDIYYSGASGCAMYYGDLTGSFTKVEGLPSYSDGYAAVGDINKNGLSDIFMIGYTNDGPLAQLMLNQGDAVEAPEAPTNVVAKVEDGVLSVSWDYDTDTATSDALVYNVAVKDAEGHVYALVPANMETGFVKVGYGRTVGLRPNVTTYSIPANDEEDYTVGVQAMSTMNETYSPFTTVTTEENGIAKPAAIKAAFGVTVNGDAISVAGVDGEFEVYNALGAKVATGLAGKAVNVAAHGIYIISANDQSKKIIK